MKLQEIVDLYPEIRRRGWLQESREMEKVKWKSEYAKEFIQVMEQKEKNKTLSPKGMDYLNIRDLNANDWEEYEDICGLCEGKKHIETRPYMSRQDRYFKVINCPECNRET